MKPQHLGCPRADHLAYRRARMQRLTTSGLACQFAEHYPRRHRLRRYKMPDSLGLGTRVHNLHPGLEVLSPGHHRRSHMDLARICLRSWPRNHASMARLSLPAPQYPQPMSAWYVETSPVLITMRPVTLVLRFLRKICHGWRTS
jgi:hypothetical protein